MHHLDKKLIFLKHGRQTTPNKLLKHHRIRHTNSSNHSYRSNDEILATAILISAVALAKFGKMWVGLIILSYDILITKSSHDPFTTLSNQLFGDFTTLFKMAVPACTYSVQNNLLFIALHHLDSSLYQITYQLKIFTAALFAIALLGKSFSARQFIDANTIKTEQQRWCRG